MGRIIDPARYTSLAMIDLRPSTHRSTTLARSGALLTWLVGLLLLAFGGQGEEGSTTDDVVSSEDIQDTSTGDDTQDGASQDGALQDGASQEEGAADVPAAAHVIRIDSAIHPVAADFIEASLQKADDDGAAILVIELSTPGGLLTSTRSIAKSLLKARTPVAVYVSPSGAHAASAGFFILMAGDLAAMAPGTNSGAAHPVAGSGQDIEGDMGDKVEEDSAALIRSLARQHGRNLELAEAAVLESRSFTAEEALKEGLIDVIATDIEDLLKQVDGREVTKIGEETVVLRTAGAPIIRPTMPTYQRILGILANPAIAALLMGLGGLGLYVELTNPGGIFPGVMGAICLILGFYAMSVLPINIAGIALVGLGLALFVFEVQVPSFGLLTLGGSLCLILGSVMLFKDTVPSFSEGLDTIVFGAVVLSMIMGGLGVWIGKTRRTPVTTGKEGLMGEHGVVRSVGGGAYRVFVHGELWRAESEEVLAVDDAVEVVALDGLTLNVRPLRRVTSD